MDILFYKIIDFYFGVFVCLGFVKFIWGVCEIYIWGIIKNFRVFVYGCIGKWFWGELISIVII